MQITFRVQIASLARGLAAAALAQSASGVHAEAAASPLFGVAIPPGCWPWENVAPSQETGSLDEWRVVGGNAPALQADRGESLAFPDSTMLATPAWKRVQSSAFSPAWAPGAATTVQFMVKDAKRYALTGGWAFDRFIDGQPVVEAQHRTGHACHAANVKDHDIFFTRLAP